MTHERIIAFQFPQTRFYYDEYDHPTFENLELTPSPKVTKYVISKMGFLNYDLKKKWIGCGWVEQGC